MFDTTGYDEFDDYVERLEEARDEELFRLGVDPETGEDLGPASI